MDKLKLIINRFEVEDEISIEVVSSTDGVIKRLDEIDNKLLKLSKTLSGETKNSTNTAKNSLSKLNKTIDDQKNKVNASSDSWTKFTKSITGNLVRFRIIKDSISAAASSLKGLADKAAEYEESLNLYTLSLGNYADQGKAWAEEISTALYLDPTTIYQYEGALNNLITGLNVSADKAYLMSTNLTQLAFDMSSYLNMDYQTAYDRIQSGISGQIRGLRQAGIALTEASLAELAYSLGIKKSIEDMTEAEKVQLRYIQIMRSTKNIQGDLARTMMTPMNAMRMVGQQFQLLGRAVGKVFLPIIMQAIPYVMALTNVLTDLANRLASFLGYEITEIDYDSVSDFGGALENLGKTADGTGKKVKNMLAPFDDLNVVMSKSSGSSGNASDGLIDFSEYLTGYDMLEGWTDKFQKSAEAAEETIKKLLPWVTALMGAFAVKKVLNFSDAIKKIADGMSGNKGKITGFTGIMKGVVDSFKDGKKQAESLGKTGLPAIFDGLQNILTPGGKALGVIGLFATAAFGAAGTMRDFASGADTSVETLDKLAGFVGIPALLAAGFIGPWGLAAVAIGGVAGGIIGYTNELKKAQEYQEYQKKYDTLFDNQGISLNVLRDELGKMFQPISDYNTAMSNLSNTTKDAKDNLNEAITGVQNLHTSIESGDYESDAEKVKAIRDAYSTLKDAIIESDKSEQDRQIAQLDRLLKEGKITKDTYNSSIKVLKDYTNLRAAEARGYTQELADLDAKLATGKITQKEYNDEVAKLASDYSSVASHGKDLQLNMLGIYDVVNKGFDLENPEKMKDSIDKLKEEYNNLLNSTKTTYDTSHELNLQQLEDYDIQLATLKRYGEEGSKEYETIRNARNNLYDADLLLTEQYNEDMASIGSTYKDVMLTMLAQIDEAGLTSNRNVSDIVSSIKGSLKELKDYDVSESSAGIFEKFTKSFEAEGGKFSETAKGIFKGYAGEIADAYDTKLSEDLRNMTVTAPGELKPYINKAYKELGEYSADGLSSGISSEKSKKIVTSSINNLADAQIKAYKDYNDIHSPSKLYAEMGMYQVMGIAEGINTNSKFALDAISNLTRNMEKQMNSVKLSLNIDTSIETSFNSMLSKLQSFCNKWRKGINSLVSNMKSTMNSVSVNDKGKITYNSMPKIKIEKFEDGGFPTSGDLFFANENGMPEYITSIGGRSAVANQDQMVTALTNAIITGMSRIPTNSNQGDTVVYIGNRKVYQGQGEYQNRQSDRYGTTKIVKV